MSRTANSDFHLLPMDGMSIAPDVAQKAIDNLERLNAEGKLKPIEGWPEDSLGGFMDILGLNRRPIKVNHGPGMKKR